MNLVTKKKKVRRGDGGIVLIDEDDIDKIGR